MPRPAAGDLDVHFGRAVEEEPTLARSLGDLRRALDESDYDSARTALERFRDALEPASLSPLAERSAERGLTEIGDSLAPDAYWRARTWKRVAVIFAGPAANLVLAIVIFAALFMALDPSYRLGFELRGTAEQVTATVNDVLADSPAEAAGVQPEDRIVAINGRRVDGDTIRPTIQASNGRRLRLTVERDGRDVSSPVGIVQGSSEAVQQGTDTYLWVLGLISLSLALLNLLPLLPLDGGHIVFSLNEGIRGRAVAREVYERVSLVGIALVLLLFFVGLNNDIGRLGD